MRVAMLRPGDAFGRYVIEGLLGQGGMGEVYRAFDPRLDRRVAIKVLHASHPTGAARLVREARAAAALDHPNAVAVFDVGEEAGMPYLAMELVEGRSLRGYVGDRTVPLERRVRWLVEIARALAAAHARGLVHRDVKPENVMVRDDGAVKVLDFGIARREPLDGSTVDTITAAGVIVGTPMYMAPEQMRGDEVDARTDQFSWGVLAYEVLAGARPWDTGDDAVRLVAAVLGSEPRDLLVTAPDVPAAVASAVMRALEKTPARRFESMSELLAALGDGERVAVTPRSRAPDVAFAPTLAAPSRAAGARRAISATVAAAVIAIAIGGAIVWRGRTAPTTGAPAPSASASAVRRPVAVTEHPAPSSTVPAAVAAYREGLQAFRDANAHRAAAGMRRAIELDPSLAAAHLRLPFYSDMGPAEGTEHFMRAAVGRGSLTERDRALLEAVEPFYARQPRDSHTTALRLRDVVARYPDDAELLDWLGLFELQAGRPEASLAATDRAIVADPAFWDAYTVRILALQQLGRIDEGLAAAGACAERSFTSNDCLLLQTAMLGTVGRCADMEAIARTWITRDKDSTRALRTLASALAALGRGDDAMAAALRALDDSRAPTTKAVDGLTDALAWTVLRGDFARARTLAESYESAAATTGSSAIGASAALAHAEILRELGRATDASAVAAAFLRRREGLATEDSRRAWDDPTPSLARIASEAGPAAKAELEPFLASWEARRGSAAGTAVTSVWTGARAATAWSPDEARAALARLGAAPPPRFVGGDIDLPFGNLAVGRTLRLGGRRDEAIDRLRLAAHSCWVLDSPISSTHAAYELGLALEEAGDRAGACEAFGKVVERWGKGPSATAKRAKARATALGCEK